MWMQQHLHYPPPVRACYYLAWRLSDVAGHAQSDATTAHHLPRLLETVPLTSWQPRAPSVTHSLCTVQPWSTQLTSHTRTAWDQVCVYGGGPATSVLLYRPTILYVWDYFQSLSGKRSLREESYYRLALVFLLQGMYPSWLIVVIDWFSLPCSSWEFLPCVLSVTQE